MISGVAIGSAIWLGILTSISPCPLATNIAAISFIGRRVDSPAHVLLSGLLYIAGRTVAYIALGIVLLAGLGAIDEVSRLLQSHLNEILGPVLIVVGMVLLGLIGSTASLDLANSSIQDRAARGNIWWAMLLGVLFALSFCPVSAGLFFGGLIPLSAKTGSRLLLPSLFGVGTALPVVVFAFIIAFAAQHVGKAFNGLAKMEYWARMITGTLFVLVGIHFSLTHIYGLSF